MTDTFDTYKAQFDRDGYVMMRNALTPDQLDRLRAQLDDWVEESRQHDGPYGEIADGRPRFDVEPNTHSAETPALRRISAPIEVSEDYLEVTRDNPGLDLTAHIFSPNIKLFGTKINLKLPGSGTTVKYHQDFPFEPHTNNDVMTVLYFLDDVTLENGPLEVVAGSHKGPLLPLWHNGVFTGAVSAQEEETAKKTALKCTGKAGDACLMHSRMLHGSLPNMTDAPRRLFIVTYSAEDAIPLVPNPLPHRYEGEVVKGQVSGRVRSESYEVALPEYPKTASFFGQQEKIIA